MKRCAIALINIGSNVLLGKRSLGRASYPGVWDLFGGHIEQGESVEAALVRELQEELGITPTCFAPFETLQSSEPERFGPAEFLVFRVDAWSGSPRNLLEQEHSEIRWFSILEASMLTLAHPSYLKLFSALEPRPNKAPEPTPPSVTSRADARAAPAAVVAQL